VFRVTNTIYGYYKILSRKEKNKAYPGKKRRDRFLPVPSLTDIKFLQTYFAAGAAAGSAAFFLAATFFWSAFIVAACPSFVGAAVSTALGGAAIPVVQNAKTNATTNNNTRFILNSPYNFVFI
jgi:predicted phage tail protein